MTSMSGVQRRDELDAMEDDEEVAELDRKKAVRAAVYAEVSKSCILTHA